MGRWLTIRKYKDGGDKAVELRRMENEWMQAHDEDESIERPKELQGLYENEEEDYLYKGEEGVSSFDIGFADCKPGEVLNRCVGVYKRGLREELGEKGLVKFLDLVARGLEKLSGRTIIGRCIGADLYTIFDFESIAGNWEYGNAVPDWEEALVRATGIKSVFDGFLLSGKKVDQMGYQLDEYEIGAAKEYIVGVINEIKKVLDGDTDKYFIHWG